MIIEVLYLIIATLFLAGKDASSYRMKDKNPKNLDIHLKRISRWHRDGVALNFLFVLPLFYYNDLAFIYFLYALIIRASFFDPAFNKWAGLPIGFLGSTATFDKLSSKVFGKNGAVKKLIVGTILLLTIILIDKFIW